MTVSVDASSEAPLGRVGPRRFLDWVAGCDVLFANEAEAAILADVTDPEASARALASNASGVVVKLGERGSLWYGPADGIVRVPALPGRVVDTTGAGDAFCAGFLAAWLGGAAPGGALEAGTRLATAAIGGVGGRPRRPAGP